MFTSIRIHTNKRAQVTIFFISAMATMILYAFIMINVGKTALDKTKADNGADAGALAAASVMSQCFNYNADDQGGSQNPKSNAEDQRQHEVAERDIRHPAFNENDVENFRMAIDQNTDAPASVELEQGGRQTDAGLDNVSNVKHEWGEVNNRLTGGKKRNIDQRKTTDGDSPTGGSGNNYYKKALVMGYKMAFQNMGHHRMGRLTSRLYDEFKKNISEQTVQNGMPLTFFWVDGAGRFHMITVIVEIEPTNNRRQYEDQASHSEQTNTLSKAGDAYRRSVVNSTKATGMRPGEGVLEVIFPPAEPPVELAADQSSNTAANNAKEGQKHMGKHYGNQRTRQRVRPSAASSGDNIYQGTADIIHSTLVFVSVFQFHMGGPVKGIAGDVDVPTFYPPVVSGAVASFNYTGMGRISNGSATSNSSPYYQPGLIFTF